MYKYSMNVANDGFEISVKADTNARMIGFQSVLREFFEKEKMPAIRFEVRKEKENES